MTVASSHLLLAVPRGAVDGSSGHTEAIAGSSMAGLMGLGLIGLGLTGLGVFWYTRRNRRNGSPGGGHPRGFVDADNVPGEGHSAGREATPFQYSQDTNTRPENTGYGADSTPGLATAHTHSPSSRFDHRYDSQAVTNFVVNNPDQHALIPLRMSEKGAMAYQMEPFSPSTSRPGPSSGVPLPPSTGAITDHDQRPVDRIVHELAGIMTELVRVVVDAPPPMYEGQLEPATPAPLPSDSADRRQESTQSSKPLIPPAQAIIPSGPTRGGQQSPDVASPKSPTITMTPSVTVASPDQTFEGSSGLGPAGAGPGGRFGPRPRPAAERKVPLHTLPKLDLPPLS
ncbi:hypothetical protein FRB99_005335 [Tulasnella sp. 403]|nr:hypothetical protein FRB99_005335 [Tulasnella sp. 403]